MNERAQPAPAGVAAPLPWRFGRDANLARRAAAGDQRAFEALFRRHSDGLYRYCRAILVSAQDAEDALQATMLKALRALPGEPREIAIKPWLYRVAHNESISIIRARRETVELDQSTVATEAAVEATVETRERVRALVADLETLPERQRASLVMRELSDLSYEEIAAAMGMTSGAARQAVYEARTALAELVEGREMECEAARKAISAGDGRVLRGRRLRAHVRSCRPCRDFEEGIGERRKTLAALAPPLAAPTGLALLQGVLAGGSTGGAATTLGVGAGLKAGAAVIAVVAVGGGAAMHGVLDTESEKRVSPARDASGGAAEQQRSPAYRSTPATASGAAATMAPGRADRKQGATEQSRRGNGRGGSAEAGNSASAPGHTGAAPGRSASGQGPATAPGQAGTAPGHAHSNSGGGGAATAPGQTGSSPGQTASSPSNSASAPGQTGTQGAAATAHTPTGNAVGYATAPGQTRK